MRSSLLLAVLASVAVGAWACDAEEYRSGCKIAGGACRCGYGCPAEFEYATRRACARALHFDDRYTASDALPRVGVTGTVGQAGPAGMPGPGERSNVCYSRPCVRGICIQTANERGFACKCEGTGFYGHTCDKACPTYPISGAAFPHECVVI